MNKRLLVILLLLVAPLQYLYATALTRQAIITGGRGPNGHCTISIDVDGAAEVEISGDTGVLTTLLGQTAAWRRFQCSQPLPRHPGDFSLVGINARGDIRLVRDPRGNRGSAVIRIDDRKSGRAAYTFDIQWRGFGGGHNWPSVPPMFPPGHYPGAGGDTTGGSIELCQDTVTNRLNRDGYPYVAFERAIPDRSPGREDRIVGVVNGRRGFEVTWFSFSCSVDFWSHRIQSLDMQQQR
jgi:hypothetical protein